VDTNCAPPRKRTLVALSLALMLAAVSPMYAQNAPTPDAPTTSSPWFVRIGVLDAVYHPGATIATSGQRIPDATATVSDNTTLMFDLGFDVTKHVAVQLMGGVPPKPTVTGQRAVASLADLGRVRYGPVFLTGVYRIRDWHRVRPYVGGGAAYAIILKDYDRSVSDLIVRNNWGFALQGGIERELGRWAFFADVKELWLSVDAHGSLQDGVPVTARVKLNPTVMSFGIKLRLN